MCTDGANLMFSVIAARPPITTTASNMVGRYGYAFLPDSFGG